MTQETINNLTAENTTLKNEAAQHKANFDGLCAQLDAHKQMLNECLGTSIQLRTHIIILQKNIQELHGKLNEAQVKINQLSNANAPVPINETVAAEAIQAE